MSDLDPIPMDRTQIRHLQDVRELWERYESVMALQEKFRGAMGWKKVGSAEYLTLYWTDPATGKKVMNSRGRRSPETEHEKEEFDRVRAEVDKVVDELKRDLEPLIRVGRALRIGRLETIAGSVLRQLSKQELLGPGLYVIGSAAMSLYEASAGAMLPIAIRTQGDLDLLSSADSPQEAMEHVLPIIRRADRSFAIRDPSGSISNIHGFRVDLHTRQSLHQSIDQLEDVTEEQVSVLHSLVALKPVSAVTISTDGAPIGMTGMDPRAFALTKYALASSDPRRDGAVARLAKDQAFAVGRLVTRFGARPFEDEHLAAFPAFAESIETGDPEAAETIGRFLGP